MNTHRSGSSSSPCWPDTKAGTSKIRPWELFTSHWYPAHDHCQVQGLIKLHWHNHSVQADILSFLQILNPALPREKIQSFKETQPSRLKQVAGFSCLAEFRLCVHYVCFITRCQRFSIDSRFRQILLLCSRFSQIQPVVSWIVFFLNSLTDRGKWT